MRPKPRVPTCFRSECAAQLGRENGHSGYQGRVPQIYRASELVFLWHPGRRESPARQREPTMASRRPVLQAPALPVAVDIIKANFAQPQQLGLNVEQLVGWILIDDAEPLEELRV
jgi:hypothetical protein